MTDTATTEREMQTDADPTPSPEAVTEPSTTTEQVSAEDEFDKERALRTIRAQREREKIADRERKELEGLRAKFKAIEDEKLSEQDRLTKRLAEVEAERDREKQHNRNRLTSYEVKMAAQNLNIVDPDAALKLVSLEYGDDGEPIDIEGSLKQLIEDKPYLVRTEQAPQRQPAGNPTNPATRAQTPGTRVYTAREIADRGFYLANKDDINRAMREGRVRD